MADQSIQYLSIDAPQEGVLVNAPSIDALVRANGAVLVHYKAIRCPVGLTSAMDDRRPHDDHIGCSNGHIYKEAGTVTTTFTNNSSRVALKEYGEIDSSVVSVTLPRYYDNTEDDILVAQYDRFYFKDDVGAIETEDTVEASRTGIDRLRFPIVDVEYLIDANGIEYSKGDFQIIDGNIKWIGPKRPTYDSRLGKGVVFSCRYKFKPFFYVKTLVHEIRLGKKVLPDGSLATQRMPYAVILQREIAFENQKNDQNAPYSPRKDTSPASGGFGPR